MSTINEETFERLLFSIASKPQGPLFIYALLDLSGFFDDGNGESMAGKRSIGVYIFSLLRKNPAILVSVIKSGAVHGKTQVIDAGYDPHDTD